MQFPEEAHPVTCIKFWALTIKKKLNGIKLIFTGLMKDAFRPVRRTAISGMHIISFSGRLSFHLQTYTG